MMDKFIKTICVLAMILSILNLMFGMYGKDTYYIGIAIMDWLISMSLELKLNN
jgi:hypothetical protein